MRNAKRSLHLACIAERYNRDVIKTFQHTGLERFFLAGKKSGIQPAHAAKLSRQLARLDEASTAQDMDSPGWRLHPLAGPLKGRWSVWVNGNWRLTFKFEGQDAILVDYQDYH